MRAYLLLPRQCLHVGISGITACIWATCPSSRFVVPVVAWSCRMRHRLPGQRVSDYPLLSSVPVVLLSESARYARCYILYVWAMPKECLAFHDWDASPAMSSHGPCALRRWWSRALLLFSKTFAVTQPMLFISVLAYCSMSSDISRVFIRDGPRWRSDTYMAYSRERSASYVGMLRSLARTIMLLADSAAAVWAAPMPSSP